MPNFAYAAYTPAGEHVEGVVEADTAARAADLLHQRGILAYRTVEVSAQAGRTARSFHKRKPSVLSLQDFADFSRQLSTLLGAELPLDQCLKLVSSQAGRTRVGAFADRLATSVISGKSLSATIETEAPEAPSFMAPLIRAGEARGTLTPCLVDLARILERRVEIRSRLRSALVYPAILMVVALLTVVLVVSVLVPTLMPLFRDTGATPPLALELADGVSRFLTEQWHIALTGAAAFAGLAMWTWRRPAVRTLIDRGLARLPGLGVLLARSNVAMIARTLGTLLRNGVPLVSALALTTSVATNQRFGRALAATTEAVRGGSRLAAALEGTGVFPELAIRFVTIGEEASRLDDLLLHLADVADQENHRQIEAMLTLLTPLITLVVGVMIGGLILSVMQAVLSVNEVALQ
jgi:general secretion pathway protein F